MRGREGRERRGGNKEKICLLLILLLATPWPSCTCYEQSVNLISAYLCNICILVTPLCGFRVLTVLILPVCTTCRSMLRTSFFKRFCVPLAAK